MPIPLAIFFFESSCTCSFQFKWQSMEIPRYLIHFLSSIILLLICSLTVYSIFFWGGRKITKLDLSMFRESLLAHNHWLTLCNCMFKFCSSDWRFLCEQNRFESSAKRWKSILVAELLKSLIYKRKSRGPRTEPWGTTQVTSLSSDLIFPSETNCFLFDK